MTRTIKALQTIRIWKFSNFFCLWLLLAAPGLTLQRVIAPAEWPMVEAHSLTGSLVRSWAPTSFYRTSLRSAPRSITFPVGTGPRRQAAFDIDRLTLFALWQGDPLPFRGQQFDGNTSDYLFDLPESLLWHLPQTAGWSIHPPNGTVVLKLPGGSRWNGVELFHGTVRLKYQIGLPRGPALSVSESVEAIHLEKTDWAWARTMELGPLPQPLWILSLAQTNSDSLLTNLTPSTVAFRGSNGWLVTSISTGSWEVEDLSTNYPVEMVYEGSSTSGKTILSITGRQLRAWCRIPPSKGFRNWKQVTALVPFSSNLPVSAAILEQQTKFPSKQQTNRSDRPLVFSGSAASSPGTLQGGYRSEVFPVPIELDLLAGGLEWVNETDLAVAAWTGEIYIVQRATGPMSKATYRRFATGLNEPLGLRKVGDDLVVVQKTELTRIRDLDRNGEADLFENINNDWGFSGNHHSFAYGPAIDQQGNFYLTLDGNGAFWETPYRGWVVQISADGKKMSGWSSGLRSPNGCLEFGKGKDVFFTDNEGHWIPTCKISHARQGEFYGYPSSSPFPRDQVGQQKSFAPPAVWLPRALSPSASGLAEIPDDRFGPFAGQMLVGDFGRGVVLRVALEKVKGEWQGAVWPFLKGFSSGVNRLSFGPDGRLYVGCLRRTWGSSAPRDFSLERVEFTGEVPFEMQRVAVRSNGFEIFLTQPCQGEGAADPEAFEVAQFGYKYHAIYGSPEIDHQGKENSATPLTVKTVTWSEDRRALRLVVEGLRTNQVTRIRAPELKNSTGKKLVNDTAYYTLNQLP